MRAGLFELPQRLINELYERPAFIPREKAIVAALKAKIDDLPKTIAFEQASKSIDLPKPDQPFRENPVIPMIASLSAGSFLPSDIQSLERILLIYITDNTLSPDLRFKLRQIAQGLLALYPQALIAEAARYETAHKTPKAPQTVPEAFPKATPVADVGKLGRIVRMRLNQTHPPSEQPE